MAGNPLGTGAGGRRLRGCLLNMALLAVTGLITVAALETGLRYAAHGILPDGEWLSTSSVFRSHDRMGIALRPGATRLLVTGGAYTARDRINAMGTRGPMPPGDRDPGERRVLVLGDSFVFGQGVALHQALPAVLEKLVEGIEVINAGIPGYTLGQEYVFFREELGHLQPDIVLVGFFMNDLDETRFLDLQRDDAGVPVRYTMMEDAPLRKLERSSPGLGSRLSTRLKKSSILYTLIRNRLDSMRYSAPAPEEGDAEPARAAPESPTYVHIFRKPPPAETLSRWDQAWKTLDALNDLVAAEGARLGIFYIPANWQLSDEAMAEWARFYGVDPGGVDHRQPQAMLRHWAERTGVPFVDLLPAFEGQDRTENYFSHDLHWNEKGHAVAAAALARALEEAGLF